MRIYKIDYGDGKTEITSEALETLIGKRWNLFVKEIVIDFDKFSIKINDKNVIRGE